MSKKLTPATKDAIIRLLAKRWVETTEKLRKHGVQVSDWELDGEGQNVVAIEIENIETGERNWRMY